MEKLFIRKDPLNIADAHTIIVVINHLKALDVAVKYPNDGKQRFIRDYPKNCVNLQAGVE